VWRRHRGIEAYAHRVLVNTSISWWRRGWRRERPTEFPPEQAAPDRLDEQLGRDVLWRHVKALPARQRAVLVCVSMRTCLSFPFNLGGGLVQ